jgi:ABC-type transporter Mla subunit MlaD
MRVGILLLVAAALLLLWLVVGWRGGVDPRNYEVE